MVFRVTQLALQNQALRYTAQHNASIFRAQQQLTSGLRFERPSQEPQGFQQVSQLGNRFGRLQIQLSHIQSTQSVLNNSVSELTEANNLITAASSLAQQGVQATDATEREALALEAQGILDQLQSIANSQFRGEYIFGGTRTGRPPFSFSTPGVLGRSLSVDYLGSVNSANVPIGDQLYIDNYYSGLQIFGRGERGAVRFFGHTGVQSGLGTDSLTSRATLEVTQGAFTVSGNSGLQIGNSEANKSIIGQFRVRIDDTSGDGSGGVISVNGGPEVVYDSLQTNLTVTIPGGRSIRLDTSNITPGFNGEIDLTAGGFLSVDGGRSRIAIDFSGNQVVTDSFSGEFINVNSAGIIRTGFEHLDFTGTSDSFQVLDNLVNDLRNTRGLSDAERAIALDDRLGELEDVRQRILLAVGQQSTSLRTLESLEGRKNQQSLEIQSDASEIQGTDFAQAALELSTAQSLLEYSFAVTAQINSVSILDYLR